MFPCSLKKEHVPLFSENREGLEYYLNYYFVISLNRHIVVAFPGFGGTREQAHFQGTMTNILREQNKFWGTGNKEILKISRSLREQGNMADYF